MKTRDLILVTLGRLVQMGLVFLTVRAITHFLPMREVGVLFLIQSLVGFFGLVAINPVGTFFNRELHGWMEKGQGRMALRAFFRFSFTSAVAAALMLAAVLALPLTTWSSSVGGPALLIATGTMVLGTTLNNTFIPALNLLERRGLFVALTVASQAAALTTSILLVYWTSPVASQWLIANGGIFTLFGAAAYLRLMKMAPSLTPTSAHIDESAISAVHPYRHVRAFALPLVIANLGVWGLTQGYRPLIEGLHGLDALAVIGLGLGLAASLAGALETLVHQLFLPKFYKQSHTHQHSERIANWSALWRVVVPIYLGAVLFMLLFSKSIVITLAGEKYLDAARYLQFAALAELMRMLGNLFALYSQSERRTHTTIVPYLCGATTCLICAAMLQPENLGFAILTGQFITLAGLSRTTLREVPTIHLRLSLREFALFVLAPTVSAIALWIFPLPPVLMVSLGGMIMTAATVRYWLRMRGDTE